jgi:hypothetical protein
LLIDLNFPVVYEKNQRFLEAVQETPASLVVAIICFLSVWSILGLAGFHTYLIFSNQTTNEDIKGSFSSRRGIEVQNPFSKPGFCANCCDILCGPFHPSLLRRRQFVTEEELGGGDVIHNMQNWNRNAVGGMPVSSPTPTYGTTEQSDASSKPGGGHSLPGAAVVSFWAIFPEYYFYWF